MNFNSDAWQRLTEARNKIGESLPSKPRIRVHIQVYFQVIISCEEFLLRPGEDWLVVVVIE